MSKYGYEEAFAAEFYDPFFVNSPVPDIDFFRDYAKTTGGKILELACGTGRILIALAQAGCEITGLDISPSMLDICRRKVAEQPADIQKHVHLVQANMVDFRLDERYALVIIPAHSFQILIAPKEQELCLRSIARHLIPRGHLILNVFQPFVPRLTDPKYLTETNDKEPVQTLPDGRVVRRANRTSAFHRAEQYSDVELIYYVKYPDGKEERLVQTFSMYNFFRYEMEHLLRLSGFKVIELFGNFDKSPLSDNSPEMIFVAEKV
jgi:ubiquinone/menaquinone biosynthesis C-methylase UbiE